MPDRPPPRIAVIGAGAAGLSCARLARDAGLRVQVFEKSRGIGGRLATRRPFGPEDPLGLDHGAPVASPSARESADADFFAALGAPWTAEGLPPAARIGRPGMSDFLRPLATPAAGAPLAIAFETEIAEIAEGAEDWLLRDQAGAVHGPFDAVIAAAPAPQSRALLGAACPEAETDAAFAPTLSVLAVTEGAIGTDRPAVLPAAPPPLRVVYRDGAKPGRASGRQAWIAHAQAEWSATHLRQEKAAIAEALWPALAEAIGSAAPARGALAYLAGHRWRYGLVTRPVSRAFWLSPPGVGPGPLGCCGDWRLGPTVGDALESGRLLGAALAKRLLG